MKRIFIISLTLIALSISEFASAAGSLKFIIRKTTKNFRQDLLVKAVPLSLIRTATSENEDSIFAQLKGKALGLAAVTTPAFTYGTMMLFGEVNSPAEVTISFIVGLGTFPVSIGLGNLGLYHYLSGKKSKRNIDRIWTQSHFPVAVSLTKRREFGDLLTKNRNYSISLIGQSLLPQKSDGSPSELALIGVRPNTLNIQQMLNHCKDKEFLDCSNTTKHEQIIVDVPEDFPIHEDQEAIRAGAYPT